MISTSSPASILGFLATLPFFFLVRPFLIATAICRTISNLNNVIININCHITGGSISFFFGLLDWFLFFGLKLVFITCHQELLAILHLVRVPEIHLQRVVLKEVITSQHTTIHQVEVFQKLVIVTLSLPFLTGYQNNSLAFYF